MDEVTPAKLLPESATWPYVFAFALEMEKKLAANRHKGDREGWLKDGPEALFYRLAQEAGELDAAIQHRSHDVGGEAADVANFAMMIADVTGQLPVDVAARRATPKSGEAEVRVSIAAVKANYFAPVNSCLHDVIQAAERGMELRAAINRALFASQYPQINAHEACVAMENILRTALASDPPQGKEEDR